MEKLYTGSKAIMLFLIIVILSQLVGGDKFAQSMVLVILFSMIILNADNFTAKLKEFTNSL